LLLTSAQRDAMREDATGRTDQEHRGLLPTRLRRTRSIGTVYLAAQ